MIRRNRAEAGAATRPSLPTDPQQARRPFQPQSDPEQTIRQAAVDHSVRLSQLAEQLGGQDAFLKSRLKVLAEGFTGLVNAEMGPAVPPPYPPRPTPPKPTAAEDDGEQLATRLLNAATELLNVADEVTARYPELGDELQLAADQAAGTALDAVGHWPNSAQRGQAGRS